MERRPVWVAGCPCGRGFTPGPPRFDLRRLQNVRQGTPTNEIVGPTPSTVPVSASRRHAITSPILLWTLQGSNEIRLARDSAWGGPGGRHCAVPWVEAFPLAPSVVVVPTTERSDPQTTTPEQIQFVLLRTVGTIVVAVRRMCGSSFQGISTEA